jgi:hypothetical protein
MSVPLPVSRDDMLAGEQARRQRQEQHPSLIQPVARWWGRLSINHTIAGPNTGI